METTTSEASTTTPELVDTMTSEAATTTTGPDETTTSEAATTTTPQPTETTTPQAATTTPDLFETTTSEAVTTTPDQAATTTPEPVETTTPEAANTTPDPVETTTPEAVTTTPEPVLTTIPESVTTTPDLVETTTPEAVRTTRDFVDATTTDALRTTPELVETTTNSDFTQITSKEAVNSDPTSTVLATDEPTTSSADGTTSTETNANDPTSTSQAGDESTTTLQPVDTNTTTGNQPGATVASFRPACPQCDTGGVAGDPHLVTFDGLRYSCQGRGEFILLETASGVKIQSRHDKQEKGDFVSLATGVVVSGGNDTPTVQISLPDSNSSNPEVFIDSNATNVVAFEYEDVDLRVTKVGSTFEIFYKTLGFIVFADFISSNDFPHLDIRVALPASFRNEEIRGLLGSAPDDDVENDWMLRNGSIVSVPKTESALRGADAYNYSMNWCITNASESLFHYSEVGFDFVNYTGCDEPFPGDVNISSATSEIVTLCGENIACLIDGVVLGLNGAQNLLESDAAVTGTSSTARFTTEPSILAVGVPVDVILTVNFSNVSSLENITSFAAHAVNSTTREMASARPRVFLQDNGSGNGTGTIAADFTFSNTIEITPATAGEFFSFKAIPLIDGIQNETSKYVLTALNALQSFSTESGIAVVEETSTPMSGDGTTLTTGVISITSTSPPLTTTSAGGGGGGGSDSATSTASNANDLISTSQLGDESTSEVNSDPTSTASNADDFTTTSGGGVVSTMSDANDAISTSQQGDESTTTGNSDPASTASATAESTTPSAGSDTTTLANEEVSTANDSGSTTTDAQESTTTPSSGDTLLPPRLKRRPL